MSDVTDQDIPVSNIDKAPASQIRHLATQCRKLEVENKELRQRQSELEYEFREFKETVLSDFDKRIRVLMSQIGQLFISGSLEKEQSAPVAKDTPVIMHGKFEYKNYILEDVVDTKDIRDTTAVLVLFNDILYTMPYGKYVELLKTQRLDADGLAEAYVRIQGLPSEILREYFVRRARTENIMKQPIPSVYFNITIRKNTSEEHDENV